MEKILIKKISERIHKQKGFPSGPFNACLLWKCGKDKNGGACCKYGVYVDKVSYDLIIKNKKVLEKRVCKKMEDCFEKKWTGDRDYLGKDGIGTVTKKGTCIFKSKNGYGCEIVRLVIEKNLPKRMIPTACRIYPLTWEKGKLSIAKIKKNCICIHKENKTSKTIFQSHKDEIYDIFCFE